MFTEYNNLINRTQQPCDTAFSFALKPHIRFGTWRRPAAAPHKFLGFFRRVFIIFWRFCQEKICENVFIHMTKTRGTLYTCGRIDIVSTVPSQTNYSTPRYPNVTYHLLLPKARKRCGETGRS